MEELFSLLPTIIIFMFIFKRIAGIFEKTDKNGGESRNKDIIYENPENNADKDEVFLEQENLSADADIENQQAVEKTSNRDLISLSEINEKQENSIKNEIEKKPIHSRKKGEIFTRSCWDEKDIIRGVVFKEILSEPRAKRKWKPVNKD